jgi:hypothetical protein
MMRGELAGEIMKGKDWQVRAARLVGVRCSSCGAGFCTQHMRPKGTKRGACPDCGTRKAFDLSLLTTDGDSRGHLEVSCAACSRAIPNERFLSIRDWQSESPLHTRHAGRLCQFCGAAYCAAEAADLGIGIRRSWVQIPCPSCGMLGGFTLAALAPDYPDSELLDALKRLKKERWVSRDEERADLLARLQQHGRAAVEIALHHDLLPLLQIDVDAACGPLQAARMVEIGAGELVGESELAWLVRAVRDPSHPRSHEAYAALGRIAARRPDEAAVTALITGLREAENPAVRGTIVALLGAVEAPGVDAALEAASGDGAAFDKSAIPQLRETVGEWFLMNIFNPFRIGVRDTITVGEVARMALQSRSESSG